MSGPIELDLEVATDTVRVGRAFIAANRGVVTTNFTYALDYLALPGSYPIDPALPLTGGSYAVKGLRRPPVFSGPPTLLTTRTVTCNIDL